MGLNKRVRELEGKVVEMPKLETSKLDVSELPEPERQLYVAAQRIHRRFEMTNGDYKPAEDERRILEQCCRLIYIRSIDIFRTSMQMIFCHDDPTLKILFDFRLLRFLDETKQATKRGK